MLVIEADDVNAWYQRAGDHQLPIVEPLTQQVWGHRSFRVRDPNGVIVYIFAKHVPAS